MAAELGERTGLQLDHARQWLTYVGLETPADQIDGGPDAGDTVNQAREVLEAGSRRLLDEIRLSLDFYAQQPDVPAVEEIVISGEGAAIPGIGAAVADGLRLRRREVSPAALEDRDDLDVGRLATSYGLALEE